MTPSNINPFPGEILSQICEVLSANSHHTALLSLMRSSSQLYDIVSPLIYKTVSLDSSNVQSFIHGLDPVLTTNIRMPKPTLPQQSVLGNRPAPSTTIVHERRLRQFENIRRVILDKSISECPQLPRWSERVASLAGPPGSTLLWLLAHSTTHETRLFPSLRQITYYEELALKLPFSIDGPAKSGTQTILTSFVVSFQPVITAAQAFCTQSQSTVPMIRHIAQRWNICIRTQSPDTFRLYDCDMSEPKCPLSLIRWLLSFKYIDIATINNLSLHTDHHRSLLYRIMGNLPLLGTSRLFLRYCSLSKPEIITEEGIENKKRESVRHLVNIIRRLLDTAGCEDGDDFRMELHALLGRTAEEADIVRKATFSLLRPYLGTGDIRFEAMSESGPWLLVAGTSQKGRREVKLVGGGEEAVCGVCNCGSSEDMAEMSKVVSGSGMAM